MFDDPRKELWRLQEQLLAEEEAAEEEYEEEYEEDSDDLDLDAIDELLSEEADEEEEEQELFYRNHANGYGSQVRNYANRYGRGSPKEFDYLEDEDELSDEEYLFRDDYRKAKRKKKNIGWVIIALLEVIAIGAIGLWWLSWMR